MRKLLVMAIMLMTAIAGFAQAEKPYVCVAVFDNEAGYSYKAIANTIRDEVMQGLIATTRVEVLDITTQNLPNNKNQLLEVLKEKGCDYLLEGTLNTITTTEAYNKKDRSATVTYTLTITEVATKLTKNTKTFKETGVGATNDKAIQSAAEDVHVNMQRLVDENFKVAATIKTLDQIDEKKGVVKTCYISMGSELGIQKGQIFEVFADVEVAGERISKKIGELKAKEVLSGTLTLCDVKNGGDVIKKNFEAGIPMVIQTRAKKDFLGVKSMFNKTF